jgi:type IV pilus assembly protein PilY1
MRHIIRRTICMALVWAMVPLPQAFAASTATVYTPITAIPANAVTTQAKPVIMLNMSKDHQLFYRAYNEFTDYNNDGQPDGGYIHANRYSGYFDSSKCYAYSTTSSRFVWAADATDKYCASGTSWSGNFLNWATMTRMDMVRKVLYGGYRSTDTNSLTVLERASLPMDAHSFAKYYTGSDIDRLTPYTGQTELTMCNTTKDVTGAYSHTTTQPPLMRVARGNYSLWNANERRQCRWSEENDWSSRGAGNGNSVAVTGLSAASDNPVRASVAMSGGNNGDFIVRVEACNSAHVGGERCRQYPGGNYKPIGLLHEYGETDQAEFGLITGSFSRNIAGGILRRNVTSFAPEVNTTTDGTYTALVGIVGTINKLRIFGYDYGGGGYTTNTDGGCTYQLTSLTNDQCASWGNPIGEMFTEALRYLKGLAPASDYGSNADAKGDTMGLPHPAWVDPFSLTRTGADGTTLATATYGVPQCRPIDVINFNASVVSYDRDTQGPFGDLGATGSLASYVNAVGSGEGLPGTNRFVGHTASVDDKACTAKTLANLSDVEGLCPTAPAYKGSYSLAGEAYWAHTNAIRSSAALPLTSKNTDPNFHVNTYSVALAPGVPRIAVATTGATPLKAIIQPSYLLNKSATEVGNGTLVDFRVVSQTATHGKYLVVWEDSQQGGDYDQDASGILEWNLSGTTLTVTTSTFADATVNAQGFGYTISGTNRDGVHFHSGILNFSYTDPTVLPVTQADGTAHPNVNASGGCNNCQKNQPASKATYTVTGNTGGTLEDPLWYAAKWGGYKVTYSNTGVADLPDAVGKWDAKDANGNATTTGDGTPDNYFLVFNPDQLEAALRSVFQSALEASNAAPAVSSSQLTAGGYKYLANFSISKVSGDVEAFPILNTGAFATSATWTAGAKLAAIGPTGRNVITNDGQLGIAFDWTTLNASTDYKAALTTGSVSAQTVAQAQATVNYMRGDRINEGTATGQMRERPATNILGPIVSAAPWIQDRPVARYTAGNHPGYGEFATAPAQAGRKKLLWVASDDGMVHAYEAPPESATSTQTGAALFSYAPGALAQRFFATGQQGFGVTAYVDGTPFSADVSIGNTWRTYLFGALGRGGRGIYALDATTPSTLTQGNASSVFKWEFTADHDTDLGYVLSDISIEPGTNQPAPVAKLNNGKYGLILGNGYRSRDGHAALFVVPADGPSAGGSWTGRFTKIVADATSTDNGLSTATWIDLDNNGTADVVYAGDLKGNLWKFDISSSNPADWHVAFTDVSGVAQPLYTARGPATVLNPAGDVLPITGAPQFNFPSMGGVMVTFATGLANTGSEYPRTGVTQRVFGIWDRPAFAARTRALPNGVGTLVQRTLTRASTGVVTVAAGAVIDYVAVTGAKDGWYINLPGSSEMVISNLEYRLNNILMTSIRPASGGGVSCSDLPLATLFVFDPVTGLPNSDVLAPPTIDPGTGLPTGYTIGIPVDDQKLRFANDRTLAPSLTPSCTKGSAGCTCTGTGANEVCTKPPICPDGSGSLRAIGRDTNANLCFSQSNARIQWREVPGLRTK